MKAYIVEKYGKAETLHLTHMPDPIPKENEVLIQIHSAAVNSADIMLKNGDFKLFLPYKTPFVSGHDMAGTIVDIGKRVTKFNVGDMVYARAADFNIGTFADLICADENDVALKPTNITMEEAASIPLVGLTSWQALVEMAGIKKGQKVFIQAGSGGVGTFAIQLAKYFGAFVATTTSASNFALVKALGADLVIDYKKEDFSTTLTDYDIVLYSNKDLKKLENSLKILKPGGILVSLTGPPTAEFAESMGVASYIKMIANLLSFTVRRKAKKLGVRFKFLFMRADGRALAEITKLIEMEKIRPVIDQEFPFEQINEAMSYVETGRSKGKVVIKIK
jgi:NADPH:quinone reductase-like Zn-dependent oxidoreductase